MNSLPLSRSLKHGVMPAAPSSNTVNDESEEPGLSRAGPDRVRVKEKPAPHENSRNTLLSTVLLISVNVGTLGQAEFQAKLKLGLTPKAPQSAVTDHRGDQSALPVKPAENEPGNGVVQQRECHDGPVYNGRVNLFSRRRDLKLQQFL